MSLIILTILRNRKRRAEELKENKESKKKIQLTINEYKKKSPTDQRWKGIASSSKRLRRN